MDRCAPPPCLRPAPPLPPHHMPGTWPERQFQPKGRSRDARAPCSGRGGGEQAKTGGSPGGNEGILTVGVRWTRRDSLSAALQDRRHLSPPMDCRPVACRCLALSCLIVSFTRATQAADHATACIKRRSVHRPSRRARSSANPMRRRCCRRCPRCLRKLRCRWHAVCDCTHRTLA